jgi:hypothetical protein
MYDAQQLPCNCVFKTSLLRHIIHPFIMQCGVVSVLLDVARGKGNNIIRLWPRYIEQNGFDNATRLIVLRRKMTGDGPHYQYFRSSAKIACWDLAALPNDINEILHVLDAEDPDPTAILRARIATLKGHS